MSITRAAWPALAVAALLSLPLTASPAAAQGAVVATYGDWEMRCDTPPGAQFEQCSLFQWVQAENRDNIGLVTLVVKTADQAAQLMRVVAPLGILLPAGMGLTIDGEQVGRAEFIRCQVEGCYVEILLEEELLEQLEGGETAEFTIFAVPEEGIVVPISLAGFSEGFAALP